MRPLKLLIGLVLLPACAASTTALAGLLRAIGPGTDWLLSPSTLALAGGFCSWLAIFIFLPKPIRTYVLAHELTHALWGLAMGSRVHRIKVGARGGSVTLSKTNFLITLAPYFFPFYTFIILLLYLVLLPVPAARAHPNFWLALVGFTWGFHLTFTLHTLAQPQPDIQEGGKLFSYTIIYLFNVIGICIWITAVTPVSASRMTSLLLRETHHAYATTQALIGQSIQSLRRPTQ